MGARLLSMGLRGLLSCPCISAVCRRPGHLPHGPSSCCWRPSRQEVVNRPLWPFFARLWCELDNAAKQAWPFQHLSYCDRPAGALGNGWRCDSLFGLPDSRRVLFGHLCLSSVSSISHVSLLGVGTAMALKKT